MPLIRALPNKPLVEAILELRWQTVNAEGDPHYILFVGKLYDQVKSEYPFHEQLPAAQVPIQIAGNIVQHRFRKDEGKWPLLQVGHGIITINDTEGYSWGDFSERAKSFVKTVYEVHPKSESLKIDRLTLRYIDAFDHDMEQEDSFEYLREKLKCTISLPTQLFEDTSVINRPQGFVLTTTFKTEQPKGKITVRFGSGEHKGKHALIMETGVSSGKDEMSEMPGGFEEWLEKAHSLTDDWFFKFIEGELERRFAGE